MEALLAFARAVAAGSGGNALSLAVTSRGLWLSL